MLPCCGANPLDNVACAARVTQAATLLHVEPKLHSRGHNSGMSSRRRHTGMGRQPSIVTRAHVIRCALRGSRGKRRQTDAMPHVQPSISQDPFQRTATTLRTPALLLLMHSPASSNHVPRVARGCNTGSAQLQREGGAEAWKHIRPAHCIRRHARGQAHGSKASALQQARQAGDAAARRLLHQQLVQSAVAARV